MEKILQRIPSIPLKGGVHNPVYNKKSRLIDSHVYLAPKSAFSLWSTVTYTNVLSASKTLSLH